MALTSSGSSSHFFGFPRHIVVTPMFCNVFVPAAEARPPFTAVVTSAVSKR
jgi:hypothetical protein